MHEQTAQREYLSGIRLCLGDILGDDRGLCLGEVPGIARGLLVRPRGLDDRCRIGRLNGRGVEGIGNGAEGDIAYGR